MQHLFINKFIQATSLSHPYQAVVTTFNKHLTGYCEEVELF